MFDELGNGNTKCGICQTETVRLISHMSGSPGCNKVFNMVEFKINFAKHKAKLRKRKQEEREKVDDPKRFRESHNNRVRKNEQKKKVDDHKRFRESNNNRVRKVEQKRKADDTERFRENHSNRVGQSYDKII